MANSKTDLDWDMGGSHWSSGSSEPACSCSVMIIGNNLIVGRRCHDTDSQNFNDLSKLEFLNFVSGMILCDTSLSFFKNNIIFQKQHSLCSKYVFFIRNETRDKFVSTKHGLLFIQTYRSEHFLLFSRRDLLTK